MSSTTSKKVYDSPFLFGRSVRGRAQRTKSESVPSADTVPVMDSALPVSNASCPAEFEEDIRINNVLPRDVDDDLHDVTLLTGTDAGEYTPGPTRLSATKKRGVGCFGAPTTSRTGPTPKTTKSPRQPAAPKSTWGAKFSKGPKAPKDKPVATISTSGAQEPTSKPKNVFERLAAKMPSSSKRTRAGDATASPSVPMTGSDKPIVTSAAKPKSVFSRLTVTKKNATPSPSTLAPTVSPAKVAKRPTLLSKLTSKAPKPDPYALHAAAWRGDAHEVQRQLQSRNATKLLKLLDKGGLGAVHLASWRGHSDVLRLLLEGGADVNMPDAEGLLPIHYASWADRESAARVLLAAGSAVNPPPKGKGKPWKVTPLIMAGRAGHVELAALLIDGGASLDCGKTMPSALHEAALAGQAEVVAMMLRKRAEVDIVKPDTLSTPLHLAACKGHLAVMAELIDGGASLLARNKAGYTPLHMAAEAGQLTAARALIEAGSLVEAQDNTGSTPLHVAVDSGRVEMARLLLNAGANHAATNKRRVQIIQCARGRDLMKLFAAMKAYGNPNYPSIPGTSPLPAASVEAAVQGASSLGVASVDEQADFPPAADLIHGFSAGGVQQASSWPTAAIGVSLDDDDDVRGDYELAAQGAVSDSEIQNSQVTHLSVRNKVNESAQSTELAGHGRAGISPDIISDTRGGEVRRRPSADAGNNTAVRARSSPDGGRDVTRVRDSNAAPASAASGAKGRRHAVRSGRPVMAGVAVE